MRALLIWSLALMLGVPASSQAQREVPRLVTPVPEQQATALPSGVPLGVPIPQSQSTRSWLRYPLIGAAVGGVGLQLYYLQQCRQDNSDGCMGGVAPLALGAVAGAAVGGAVELIWRATHAR